MVSVSVVCQGGVRAKALRQSQLKVERLRGKIQLELLYAGWFGRSRMQSVHDGKFNEGRDEKFKFQDHKG